MSRFLAPLFAIAILFGIFLTPTQAAPRLPKTNPDWYARQQTWQETIRLSRESLAKASGEVAKGNGTKPVFGGWHTIGPFARPGSKDGFEFAYPPENEIDFSKKYDNLSWRLEDRADGRYHADINLPDNASQYMVRTITAPANTALTVYVGCDDRAKVWLNGKLVSTINSPTQGTPVKLKLVKGENQLLMKTTNNSGGRGYAFSQTKDAKSRTNQNGPEAILWGLVQRDFRAAADQRSIAWEKEDGIWSVAWKTGDLRELAQRYAKATRKQASLDTQASGLASKVDSIGDLAAVRKLYTNARSIEDTLATARGVDFAPLRRALNDLTKTYGKEYPNGKAYLEQLEKIEVLRADGVLNNDAKKLVQAGEQFEALRTEALMANPLLDFEKLLVIKRRGNLGLPQNWQGNCVMRGKYDNEIATLSPVSPQGKLTTVFRPEKDVFVGDVDLHWDAGRMIFSMPGEKNRYEIFEVNVDGKELRQVTAAQPDIDNYDACYLPSEKIIYSSTGCFQGVPCVGGGNQVANLFVTNPDGTGVRRLCFDQDNDWCPTVTNDGRVMFTRWEYSDTPHYFTRVVMRMNPDGTNQKALYGSNSYWPNSTFYARSIPDHPSKFVGVISGHHGVPRMGELIVFDPAIGNQEADGVVQRIPGFGEKVEPVIKDQLVNNSWPRFLHPYPLSEKYFLTACQLDAKSPWGIYLVDVFDNITPICVEEGVAMLEPVPVRKTKRPRVIPEQVDIKRKDAVVHLSNVYTGGGLAGVPHGTVKSLRLFSFDYGYQGLASHTYIGMEGPWDVHRIVGTVDVETDGSASFKVPANTPISVQPLDADGRALQLMRSWFVAMPGENMSCVGCHEKPTDAPPFKQPLATKKAPQAIKPWHGPARGFSFDREVQPVLDRHCIGCHNDKPHQGKKLTDLRLDEGKGFSRAYKALQAHVRRPGPESDFHMFPPAEYHASTSPLIQMLQKEHHGVKLDEESYERFYTWIDLNLPYYGTWGEFRAIPRGQRERRVELRKLYAGLDEDYEVIPEQSKTPITPLIPKQVPVTKAVKVECPNWPFDTNEARSRQGEDSQRTVTFGKEGEKPFSVTLVRVPAGEFVMGDAAGFSDEAPCRVKIDRPYWISKTVITNEMFNRFDAAHDSRYLDRRGKDHGNRGNPLNQPTQPVVRVSWQRAKAFCDWLSKETGRKYSLPTEAQWEYTCRAGEAADKGGNGSVWGVDRMASMAEWTRSDYRAYPYSARDGRDNGAATGRKVVRGAEGIGVSGARRDTYRLSYEPWQGVWNVGFRIICEDEDPAVAKGAE